MSTGKEIPAWAQQCSDELDALVEKYTNVARGEGATNYDFGIAMMTEFLARAVTCPPPGKERLMLALLVEMFDETRPGWRE